MHGKLCKHPTDPNKVLILEGSASSSRVWQSTNGGATWTEFGVHPFYGMATSSIEAFNIGVIPDYGVIIAMSSGGGVGGETRLWKPNG